MTWYLILYLSYASCPGGWLGAKALPLAARQYACTPRPEWALETSRPRAVARIQGLDEPCRARVFACHGLKCKEVENRCAVVQTFGEGL